MIRTSSLGEPIFTITNIRQGVVSITLLIEQEGAVIKQYFIDIEQQPELSFKIKMHTRITTDWGTKKTGKSHTRRFPFP